MSHLGVVSLTEMHKFWQEGPEREKRDIDMQLRDGVAKALRELLEDMEKIYGERLSGVYLYCSYARGEYREESSDEVNPVKEMSEISDLLGDLSLRCDLVISVYPVSQDWFEKKESPFSLNVRREAVG